MASAPQSARVREYVAALILGGAYRDGDILPSMRCLADALRVNPLTVAKSYQPLVEAGIVDAKHGIGMVIASGGVQRFRESERKRFLEEEWPLIVSRIALLQMGTADLLPVRTRRGNKQGGATHRNPQETRA